MGTERLRFRAKSKRNGEWCYGTPRKTALDNWLMHCDDVTECIDPDTIGQWTGLYDVDGKEIYHGDIILLEGYRCDVDWNPKVAAFCVRFPFENECGTRPLGEWLDECRKAKILGSIHETG